MLCRSVDPSTFTLFIKLWDSSVSETQLSLINDKRATRNAKGKGTCVFVNCAEVGHSLSSAWRTLFSIISVARSLMVERQRSKKKSGSSFDITTSLQRERDCFSHKDLNDAEGRPTLMSRILREKVIEQIEIEKWKKATAYDSRHSDRHSIYK